MVQEKITTYTMNKDTQQVIEALLQHEPDEWDHLLAQTASDTWWMPERVVRVMRPEIRYTYDPEGINVLWYSMDVLGMYCTY